MSKIKVLIVDDHSLTRVGLKYTFQNHPKIEVIGEAESGEEAIQKSLELKPDVILMDLGMRNINGIEATKEIRKQEESPLIIILTSHDDEEEVLGAFAAGADAYCMKDIPPEKLAIAIETVCDGVVWLDPAIADIVLAQVPNNLVKKSKDPIKDLNLTPKELEILKLLTEGYSYADIAFKSSLSMHTVKTHMYNIFNKLGVSDRTNAALKAMKEKLV